MRNSIRLYVLAIVQISLLCSCAITPPAASGHSGSVPKRIEKPGQTGGDTGHKATRHRKFDESFHINPIGSNEIDGLLVKYSLLVIPDQKGYLLRLSLVFRNLQHRTMIIRPKVLLLDASKKQISAYSKDAFIRIASTTAGKAPDIVSKTILGTDRDEYISAKSRIDFADTFWLKHRYRIPPRGIAIGVLVYHGTDLKLPLRLTVHTYRRKFTFTAKAPLPVAGK
ncbi:MAG TPA: hypothetical protein VMV70_07945 [Gallionella sp.]|nr:hypothetical protein [Gallionella sp.]